jgi:hypothetical protein
MNTSSKGAALLSGLPPPVCTKWPLNWRTRTLLATALAQNKLPTDAGMYYQNGTTFTPMKTVCNNGMKAMGFGVRGKFVYNNPSASTQVNDHHPTFVFIGADNRFHRVLGVASFNAWVPTRTIRGPSPVSVRASPDSR